MGKYGNGILVSGGNGNGMGMGMKSFKWEGIGTKNLFPHTSKSDYMQASVLGPQSVDGVRGGSLVHGRAYLHDLATADTWLSSVRRRSRVTPSTAVGYGEVDSSDRY